MFSMAPETLEKDVKLTTISGFAAAREAVKGFERLGKDVTRAFIYTGNILNTTIFPTAYVLSLGVGKAGAAYWVGAASKLLEQKGIK
jgi:hypothetical protein